MSPMTDKQKIKRIKNIIEYAEIIAEEQKLPLSSITLASLKEIRRVARAQ